MRLREGESLKLTPQEPGALASHYTVQYIGALKGKGFITTLPLSEGKGLWMQAGSTYVIRVLSGTHAYAFTSQVIRARASPYPHVHFRYPEAVQAKRVRRSARVKMSLDVKVTDGSGQAISARLLDLSMHGARLELLAPMTDDQVQLSLPIRLDEVESQLQIKGHVCNQEAVTQVSSEHPQHAGIEFGELAEQEAMLLHYFIDHTVVEGGADER